MYIDILKNRKAEGGDPNSEQFYKVRGRKNIEDLVVAVEAAKKGVTVGEDTVSGLVFVDDFVGISATPEGLNREDARIHYEKEGDGERQEIRSSSSRQS